MFGDVTGERKLDEDAMDFGVIVGFFDLKEEFCLCDGLWELDDTAEDVGLVVKLLVVMILLRGKGVEHTSSAAFSFMRTYVPIARILSVIAI